jgi:hypothetical protein
VLIISGRTGAHPWTAGALVARIARALAARGHEVTLAAQSVQDAHAFAGATAVHAFAPFNQTATDWPLGFARWARARRRAIPHDVSLSTSRVAAADVWMPLEPGALAWLRRARRTLSPPSLGVALARHHGALRAAATDLAIVAPRGGRAGPVRRVVAVGAVSAGEAGRLLHAVRGLGERVVAAPPFAPTTPLAGDARAQARERARAVLGVGAERRVVLASCPAPPGPRLDGLIASVGDLAARDPRRGPLLVVLARDTYALAARAHRLGAGEHVRAVPLTHDAPTALAMADAAALPLPAWRGPFESGSASRFAADALAAGLPLLALSGAGGYDLARARSAAQDACGLVVDEPSREAWMRTFRTALDGPWLPRAGVAAAEIGAGLTEAAFVAALERALAEAAEERARGIEMD